MNFVDRIIEFCKEQSITATRFETEAGLSRGQISKWKHLGLSPNYSSQLKAAAYMGVTLEELMREGSEGHVFARQDKILIPETVRNIFRECNGDYSGEAASGQPDEVKESAPDEYAAPQYTEHFIDDDSMQPVFLKGDTLLIEPCTYASDGDLVLISHVKAAEEDCADEDLPDAAASSYFARIYEQPEGMIVCRLTEGSAPEFFSAEELAEKPLPVKGIVTLMIRRYGAPQTD